MYENDELKRLVALSDRVRSDDALRELADDMRKAADRMRQRIRTVYDTSKYPLPANLAELLESEQ